MNSSSDSEQFQTRENSYWLSRALFVRSLGFIYSAAFLSLYHQYEALLSSNGLLPITRYLERALTYFGGDSSAAFWQRPSLFWLSSSDAVLHGVVVAGLLLAVLMMFGYANSITSLLLWIFYLSVVNTGQIFYGYGWESILLETGFFTIFLTPLVRLNLYSKTHPPPFAILVLLRWELFRVMFGAGLIKLRGDQCWHDLTCLVYHYETQPVPGPLSWYFHQMPLWFHKAGVVFNHIVELIVPWFYFLPRRICIAGGLLTIIFQSTLILSGNLSFLNWLTILLCIPCFDDRFLSRLTRKRTHARVEQLPERSPALLRKYAIIAVFCLCVALSYYPALNMISSRQRMNSSFNSFHLMNTYGAFGSIGKKRYEIVIKGTHDENPSDTTEWKEYEFECKPGDPDRRPCLITPYHYRLDWQIWFAAMSRIDRNPWLIHLVYKLLTNDSVVTALFATNPFPEKPPKFIQLDLYRYRYTAPGEKGWWKREFFGSYTSPIHLNMPQIKRFITHSGFELYNPDRGSDR